MYGSPALYTTHRLAGLNVPTPSWMRAPGECPGMFALESAMDELALAAGIDPVELRIRNEPQTEPDSGLPFSSRHLVACLREGARRFGWDARDPRPGTRRDGRFLIGSGVAASTYPARRMPSTATARAVDGGFEVRIAASDIGTGARTALTRIAAQALSAPADRVRVELGDSPMGAKGIGEIGIVGTAAAIANAVHHATGRRIRDLPITPAKLVSEGLN